MRRIGVVTVSRSDYGIYLPVLNRMREDPALVPKLFVAGSHLSPQQGLTVRDIEQHGFEICERIEMTLASDSPESIGASMGIGLLGFSHSFSRSPIEILLVLGDRYEMLAAVCAALAFNIPVAHIHGGETTEGAFDEAIRHAITKMSHLHFAATEAYARRIRQMGEESWRITVCGAPSLDNLNNLDLYSCAELSEKFQLDLKRPYLIVTYHPVTLEYQETELQIKELLDAVGKSGLDLVFTGSNTDTNAHVIADRIRYFAQGNNRARIVESFGTRAYFSLMKYASAMVGNSSSGVIEAASFRLPVVNVGNRQKGRLHGKNVIDVGNSSSEVLAGIQQALAPSFRQGLRDLVNPYGDGHAADRIAEVLRRVQLGRRLIQKSFCELK